MSETLNLVRSNYAEWEHPHWRSAEWAVIHSDRDRAIADLGLEE